MHAVRDGPNRMATKSSGFGKCGDVTERPFRASSGGEARRQSAAGHTPDYSLLIIYPSGQSTPRGLEKVRAVVMS